jgi:hypothetical protein
MEQITIKEPKVYLLFIQDREGKEILKIDENGDFFVKGKFVENDKEVVDGFREFLRNSGYPV